VNGQGRSKGGKRVPWPHAGSRIRETWHATDTAIFSSHVNSYTLTTTTNTWTLNNDTRHNSTVCNTNQTMKSLWQVFSPRLLSSQSSRISLTVITNTDVFVLQSWFYNKSQQKIVTTFVIHYPVKRILTKFKFHDWLSKGFMSHPTQNRSFWRRSVQLISWLSTETRIRDKIY